MEFLSERRTKIQTHSMMPVVSPFRLVYIFCRALGLAFLISGATQIAGSLASFFGAGFSPWTGLVSLGVGLAFHCFAPGLSALFTGENALRGEAIRSDLGRDLFSRASIRILAGLILLLLGIVAFTQYFFFFVSFSYFTPFAGGRGMRLYSLLNLLLPFLQICLALFFIFRSGFPQGRFSPSETEAP